MRQVSITRGLQQLPWLETLAEIACAGRYSRFNSVDQSKKHEDNITNINECKPDRPWCFVSSSVFRFLR